MPGRTVSSGGRPSLRGVTVRWRGKAERELNDKNTAFLLVVSHRGTLKMPASWNVFLNMFADFFYLESLPLSLFSFSILSPSLDLSLPFSSSPWHYSVVLTQNPDV